MAALRRSADDIEALIVEQARVRLCKGAYVEPASVAFPDKADVDAAYGRLMERLLRDGTHPARGWQVRRPLTLTAPQGQDHFGLLAVWSNAATSAQS